MRIEIISIGKELVAGRARDSNGSYMAEKLFGAGIRVGRITLVDECVGDISSLVREAMKRGAQVLLSSGGLGPTPGDVTFRAVAEAAGVALVSDPAALRLVTERYDDLLKKGRLPIPHLPPGREKMASVPSGAELLQNPVGIAPGIKMRAGFTTIYCLPGEPAELKGIFEETVYPEVLLLFGGGAVVVDRIISQLKDESVIYRLGKMVEKRFPFIFVMIRSGKEDKIAVEFIASEEGRGEPVQIDRAVRYFQELEKRELGEKKWIAE